VASIAKAYLLSVSTCLLILKYASAFTVVILPGKYSFPLLAQLNEASSLHFVISADSAAVSTSISPLKRCSSIVSISSPKGKGGGFPTVFSAVREKFEPRIPRPPR